MLAAPALTAPPSTLPSTHQDTLLHGYTTLDSLFVAKPHNLLSNTGMLALMLIFKEHFSSDQYFSFVKEHPDFLEKIILFLLDRLLAQPIPAQTLLRRAQIDHVLAILDKELMALAPKDPSSELTTFIRKTVIYLHALPQFILGHQKLSIEAACHLIAVIEKIKSPFTQELKLTFAEALLGPIRVHEATSPDAVSAAMAAYRTMLTRNGEKSFIVEKEYLSADEIEFIKRLTIYSSVKYLRIKGAQKPNVLSFLGKEYIDQLVCLDVTLDDSNPHLEIDTNFKQTHLHTLVIAGDPRYDRNIAAFFTSTPNQLKKLTFTGRLWSTSELMRIIGNNKLQVYHQGQPLSTSPKTLPAINSVVFKRTVFQNPDPSLLLMEDPHEITKPQTLRKESHSQAFITEVATLLDQIINDAQNLYFNHPPGVSDVLQQLGQIILVPPPANDHKQLVQFRHHFDQHPDSALNQPKILLQSINTKILQFGQHMRNATVQMRMEAMINILRLISPEDIATQFSPAVEWTLNNITKFELPAATVRSILAALNLVLLKTKLPYNLQVCFEDSTAQEASLGYLRALTAHTNLDALQVRGPLTQSSENNILEVINSSFFLTTVFVNLETSSEYLNYSLSKWCQAIISSKSIHTWAIDGKLTEAEWVQIIKGIAGKPELCRLRTLVINERFFTDSLAVTILDLLKYTPLMSIRVGDNPSSVINALLNDELAFRNRSNPSMGSAAAPASVETKGALPIASSASASSPIAGIQLKGTVSHSASAPTAASVASVSSSGSAAASGGTLAAFASVSSSSSHLATSAAGSTGSPTFLRAYPPLIQGAFYKLDATVGSAGDVLNSTIDQLNQMTLEHKQKLEDEQVDADEVEEFVTPGAKEAMKKS